MTAVDPAGRPIAVFGSTIDANSLDFQRELTRGLPGTLLTGRADRYDLEEFATAGERRDLVRRGRNGVAPRRRDPNAVQGPGDSGGRRKGRGGSRATAGR